VLAACDAKDGVKGGILHDPKQCHFDPAPMRGEEPILDSCLIQPQVTALKNNCEGARDSKGKETFPEFVPLWITARVAKLKSRDFEGRAIR